MSKFNPHRWVEPEAEVLVAEPTISLREYYIGQALANPEIVKFASKMQEEQCRAWPPVLAEVCAMAADAILNARGEAGA